MVRPARADATLLRRRGSVLRDGFWEDKSRRATDVLLVTNVAAYALQLLSRGALTSWGAKARPSRGARAFLRDGA